jgi:hypothetical protein
MLKKSLPAAAFAAAGAGLLAPATAGNPPFFAIFTAAPAAFVGNNRICLYAGRDEAPVE